MREVVIATYCVVANSPKKSIAVTARFVRRLQFTARRAFAPAGDHLCWSSHRPGRMSVAPSFLAMYTFK